MKSRAAVTYGVEVQSKVTQLSSDAELRALSEAVRESNWLQKIHD